jgi:AcrR family transcriptional regulator
MNNRTSRKGKREKIVQAAVSLFRRTHDVRRVSLETIAREARVSPTTIYNNFGTREALVTEVAKTLFREILEMARSFIRSDLPFPRKLADIIAGKIDIASQVNSEVLNKLLSQDKGMAGFVDGIFRTEITPMWLEFIAEGKRQGYIQPSIDESSLIIYFDILRAGMAARPELTRGWEKNMPVIEQLTRLMFYGFLKKDIDLFRKEEK